MDHLEMVEKLREKANVSYEEASAALEKCNWDLLDALLLLESEGKLHREGETPKPTPPARSPSPKRKPITAAWPCCFAALPRQSAGSIRWNC